MQVAQQVAHTLIPAALRDIGTGAFHLIKRDATEEHCQKLTAGAIRVAGVAATILAITAVALALPASLTGLSLVFGAVYMIDTESASLLVGSAGATLGLLSLATSVILIANGLFLAVAAPGAALGIGTALGIFGTACTYQGWYITRHPRDIPYELGPNLLSDKIDDLSASWGTELFLALA